MGDLSLFIYTCNTHTHKTINVNAYKHTCIFISEYYVNAHKHTHTHTHTPTRTHMCVRTHTHTHTDTITALADQQIPQNVYCTSSKHTRQHFKI